ncbi:MAG: Extracellular solute-binding protein, family 1 [Candidatus Curtissbacteria bacterium GW2011_GWA1_40_47]|uniref:ABC transporter substrate-binding protein n=1 Tax=Candidatus Curtissbacteria bacterium RIFOXYA1_FULL_41_14 TaxID=1797737 RepID=A0A1F5HAY2_9BACT|nr:MAG: Extracellular solute-binding protein, family 1 [Candidatus Curtissbacteria bacterium GW2011_GWB1_40_28]KKR60416.1 MAG: Extracellular solute-binding protein, family 1 [Candidatus Curtissbacteria bacterium GW2011_GWA2_40_31]KKR61262.1 MAG: extracellular solute-binding protein family 1, multiple sugar transport system substrate-binding protein [Microgenomates group bacterium GW2011_GWC1_40_35]KKR65341.1 MAG: Extracellular solute-binding protein, family 1 [Candidatus Curtissbacteria bacteriu
MPNLVKVLLLPLLFSLVLSGCSLLPGGKEEEVITIRYWGLWEDANAINQVINEYKKIKPNVNIVYEKRSPQQYRESLQSQIGSGEGPDLFRFHNTWVPMLKDILDPVPSDIVSTSDFKKNFYPTVFFDLRNNDKKFVGVPLEIDGLALYWNEDIFKAAGINSPPSTWSELAQTAIKLTVRDPSGGIRTAGIALGTASNVDHFSDILGLMILQNGGDLKSPTDQASADALEYYANFAKGPNQVWDETMPSSTFAFAGGNLAMYFGPSWRATEIKLFNPLLKFKVAPVPQLEGGNVGWASYWAEGVSAKSTNKREAWEFIKFLQVDENLVKLYSEASRTPGRILGEPYPKVSLASTLESDPIAGAYVKGAAYMRSFPMASRTFDNGLNDQIIKAYEDAINSVADGTSAKTALSTTAKNVASILGRFGIQ